MKCLTTALFGLSLLIGANLNAHASVINLTAVDSSGSDTYLGSNVRFAQGSPQSSGTGVFGTFVQIQAQGNGETERGYNTTANGIFDNGSSAQFNHAVKVSDIGFISLSGSQYMRFTLDINEPGNAKSSLTIDDLQLFLSTSPNQSTTAFNAGLVDFTNASLVYRLDSGIDDSILLDAQTGNPGSGSGDMYMDVPIELFNTAFTALGLTTANAKNGAYIYLYTAASNVDAGFEEWGATRGTSITDVIVPPGGTPVPEPISLSLMGIGLLAMGGLRKRRA